MNALFAVIDRMTTDELGCIILAIYFIIGVTGYWLIVRHKPEEDHARCLRKNRDKELSNDHED